MILGIDPGRSGAIALSDAGGLITMHKMPADKDEPNKATRNLLLLLLGWQREAVAAGVTIRAVVERVGNPTGPGSNAISGNLSLCIQRGELRMGLIASKIDFIEVMPASWMRVVAPDRPKGSTPKLVDARKEYIWQKMMAEYPSVKVHKYQGDALALLHYAFVKVAPG